MDNIEDILRALAEETPEDNNSAEQAEEDDSDGGIFSGLDIGTIMKAASLIGAASNTSDNERLLLALKPLLREENRAKVDAAVKLLKLVSLLPLLKESGILGNLGGLL